MITYETIERVKQTIKQPVYNNDSIANYTIWSYVNHEAMLRHYNALGEALGCTDLLSDEFELFSKCQWDLEQLRARK